MMTLRRCHWPAAAGFAVLVLVALGAAWMLRSKAGPSATISAPLANPASSAVSVIDGMTVVRISLAAQRRSGIATQPLAVANAPAGATTYGTVMDLQPLVAWKAKVAAASAQAAAGQAQARAAQAQLARTLALYRDDQNASLKTLQADQAAAEQAGANAQASDTSREALRQEGVLQFGAKLADALMHSTHPALLDQQHALVQVALSPGMQAPVEVDVAYGTEPPRRARWLSAAAQADARLGAHVQLYVLDRPLPAGASVSVALPGPQPTATGVNVPLEAVVWYANQPWVYVQRDQTHFARVALLGTHEQPMDFFVPSGLQPGEQVVTRGAGLLLSQEQIPPPGSGTGCKDPLN